MPEETSENDQLLRQAAAGDGASWQALVGRSRSRLRRMVAFRLDPRLQGRVDPSDVLQDADLEARRDLGSYLDRSGIPSYLWLRRMAANQRRELHRHHLGARMRDPRREVTLHGGVQSETTATAMAAGLMGDLTGASEAAAPLERRVRPEEVLGAVDPLDREVLALRHFEPFSPAETARILGIKEKAASMRHVPVLRRFKEILRSRGGEWLEP
jgi:RNA polymerase sigma-70 factor (ECF subfamily)